MAARCDRPPIIVGAFALGLLAYAYPMPIASYDVALARPPWRSARIPGPRSRPSSPPSSPPPRPRGLGSIPLTVGSLAFAVTVIAAAAAWSTRETPMPGLGELGR